MVRRLSSQVRMARAYGPIRPEKSPALSPSGWLFHREAPRWVETLCQHDQISALMLCTVECGIGFLQKFSGCIAILREKSHTDRDAQL
jgi:hypothetical protein